MKKYYYIEKDGRVFTIKNGSTLTFPSRKDEIPFKINIKTKMPFSDIEIFYCEPIFERFPYDWKIKDELVLMEDVDVIIKRAIIMSYPRLSANALIVKDKEVLLVKNNRGYLKDSWSLPGGFFTYGESPEEAIKREVKEETGGVISVNKLFKIYKKVFEGSNFYMVSFVYICNISGNMTPDKTEIDEVKFMKIEKAIKRVEGYFSKKALKDYIKEIQKGKSISIPSK